MAISVVLGIIATLVRYYLCYLYPDSLEFVEVSKNSPDHGLLNINKQQISA